MTSAALDHRRLYRLPWTLPDNGISWLEPTSACNIVCVGCYRENLPSSHKPLEVVREEIDTFQRLRKSDCISIAGGEPLLHPQIVEIVREIAARGFKPIINTNGVALTKELLRELKKAGVRGFTFHIDSKQFRAKWRGKNEIELNELRLYYAQMLAEVGGLSCAFNATVYEDNLPYVPDIVEWAARHIDIVHVVVFIAYRQIVPRLVENFEFYAGGRKVDLNPLPYVADGEQNVGIQSTDVLAVIRQRFPDFTPCAYLNGTERPDSFKWLLTVRVGARGGKILGYVGPKFMEFVQTQHHLWKDRYLAYAHPRMLRFGRSGCLLLSPLDRGARSAVTRYLAWALRNPLRLFRPLYFQSVMIIQPVDILEDGRQDMCDGCPDVTVWQGNLVWSCRLEEPKQYGAFVRTVPKCML